MILIQVSHNVSKIYSCIKYNGNSSRGISMGRKRMKKPVVEVAGSEYQPTKAEMEEGGCD